MSDWRKHKQSVWNKSGGFCWYCGVELVTGLDDEEMLREPRYFHIDHLIPRCLGGLDDLHNLVPCCRACNILKNGMEIDAFRWIMTKKANDMPKFTAEQHEWLRRHGFDPFAVVRDYQFWFEQFPRAVA